ncbi:MAG: nucleotidyltransferase family protein [Chromatiales bacterium]|jgi:dTDP-glucose pyrophosphorylase
MTKWQDISVTPDTAMTDVMQVIDRGAIQIALVMDPDQCHLLGTVTDGDLRRALLNGKGMDTPAIEFMNANPTTGLLEEGRSSWQRTMQRHTLKHLPLLNANGCVVDLARYELPSEPERANPVVLMAGGLGTRLRPLTNDLPKPLIQVGSKPVLETIVENFAEQGFRDIYLCINYKGDMIREYFGDGSQWEVNIQYLTEKQRLGTAGALSLLPQRPQQPLIVMNGDLLTKVDFVRLLDFHKRQNFTATMTMREYRHQVPYGVMQTDENYQIIQLEEKPIERYQVSAGIYVLNPETLERIPQHEYFDMPTLYQQLIDAGLSVGSFPLRDYWIDIGRLEDLEQAHADFAEIFS